MQNFVSTTYLVKHAHPVTKYTVSIVDTMCTHGLLYLNMEKMMVLPNQVIELELGERDCISYYRLSPTRNQILGFLMFEMIKGDLNIIQSNIDILPLKKVN